MIWFKNFALLAFLLSISIASIESVEGSASTAAAEPQDEDTIDLTPSSDLTPKKNQDNRGDGQIVGQSLLPPLLGQGFLPGPLSMINPMFPALNSLLLLGNLFPAASLRGAPSLLGSTQQMGPSATDESPAASKVVLVLAEDRNPHVAMRVANQEAARTIRQNDMLSQFLNQFGQADFGQMLSQSLEQMQQQNPGQLLQQNPGQLLQQIVPQDLSQTWGQLFSQTFQQIPGLDLTQFPLIGQAPTSNEPTVGAAMEPAGGEGPASAADAPSSSPPQPFQFPNFQTAIDAGTQMLGQAFQQPNSDPNSAFQLPNIQSAFDAGTQMLGQAFQQANSDSSTNGFQLPNFQSVIDSGTQMLSQSGGLFNLRPLQSLDPATSASDAEPAASQISEVRVKPDDSPLKTSFNQQQEQKHDKMDDLKMMSALQKAILNKKLPILWFHIPTDSSERNHDLGSKTYSQTNPKSLDEMQLETKLQAFQRQVITELKLLQDIERKAKEMRSAAKGSMAKTFKDNNSPNNSELSKIPIHKITRGDIEKALNDDYVKKLLHKAAMTTRKETSNSPFEQLVVPSGMNIKRQTTKSTMKPRQMTREDIIRLMAYAYRMANANGIRMHESSENMKTNKDSNENASQSSDDSLTQTDRQSVTDARTPNQMADMRPTGRQWIDERMQTAQEEKTDQNPTSMPMGRQMERQWINEQKIPQQFNTKQNFDAQTPHNAQQRQWVDPKTGMTPLMHQHPLQQTPIMMMQQPQMVGQQTPMPMQQRQMVEQTQQHQPQQIQTMMRQPQMVGQQIPMPMQQRQMVEQMQQQQPQQTPIMMMQQPQMVGQQTPMPMQQRQMVEQTQKDQPQQIQTMMRELQMVGQQTPMTMQQRQMVEQMQQHQPQHIQTMMQQPQMVEPQAPMSMQQRQMVEQTQQHQPQQIQTMMRKLQMVGQQTPMTMQQRQMVEQMQQHQPQHIQTMMQQPQMVEPQAPMEMQQRQMVEPQAPMAMQWRQMVEQTQKDQPQQIQTMMRQSQMVGQQTPMTMQQRQMMEQMQQHQPQHKQTMMQQPQMVEPQAPMEMQQRQMVEQTQKDQPQQIQTMMRQSQMVGQQTPMTMQQRQMVEQMQQHQPQQIQTMMQQMSPDMERQMQEENMLGEATPQMPENAEKARHKGWSVIDEFDIFGLGGGRDHKKKVKGGSPRPTVINYYYNAGGRGPSYGGGTGYGQGGGGGYGSGSTSYISNHKPSYGTSYGGGAGGSYNGYSAAGSYVSGYPAASSGSYRTAVGEEEIRAMLKEHAQMKMMSEPDRYPDITTDVPTTPTFQSTTSSTDDMNQQHSTSYTTSTENPLKNQKKNKTKTTSTTIEVTPSPTTGKQKRLDCKLELNSVLDKGKSKGRDCIRNKRNANYGTLQAIDARSLSELRETYKESLKEITLNPDEDPAEALMRYNAASIREALEQANRAPMEVIADDVGVSTMEAHNNEAYYDGIQMPASNHIHTQSNAAPQLNMYAVDGHSQHSHYKHSVESAKLQRHERQRQQQQGNLQHFNNIQPQIKEGDREIKILLPKQDQAKLMDEEEYSAVITTTELTQGTTAHNNDEIKSPILSSGRSESELKVILDLIKQQMQTCCDKCRDRIIANIKANIKETHSPESSLKESQQHVSESGDHSKAASVTSKSKSELRRDDELFEKWLREMEEKGYDSKYLTKTHHWEYLNSGKLALALESNEGGKEGENSITKKTNDQSFKRYTPLSSIKADEHQKSKKLNTSNKSTGKAFAKKIPQLNYSIKEHVHVVNDELRRLKPHSEEVTSSPYAMRGKFKNNFSKKHIGTRIDTTPVKFNAMSQQQSPNTDPVDENKAKVVELLSLLYDLSPRTESTAGNKATQLSVMVMPLVASTTLSPEQVSTTSRARAKRVRARRRQKIESNTPTAVENSGVGKN